MPNRSSFESQLKGLLKSLPGGHQSHALVMLDLDFFKAVNDSAGHAAGDALLREIAGLMRSLLRPGDILARLGGDEFGFILRHCSTEQALSASALSMPSNITNFSGQDGCTVLAPARG